MRLVRSSQRSIFSPPGSRARVSILSGREPEHGGFANHTIAIVLLPPGEQLDEHFHSEREESYLVLSGKGKCIVNGKEMEMGPGDLVSVSPKERHLLKADDAHTLEYVVITAPAWIREDVHT